jgi:cobalt-zinc-cadmium efflux system protein
MSHSHSHSHTPKNYNLAFAIGISLNIIFVLIEASYGVIADSLALIADAWHNLSDVVSLLLAWGANYLASRPATDKRTYGLRRATIMASLLSAILLLFALGGIAWEALERLFEPSPANGLVIIVVAAIGVVINTATALLFVSGQKHDLNIRGAYLHMAADAGVSMGVVFAGVAIMFTGWLWLDPLISLFIVLVVLVGTWNLLKDSLNLSIDAVPKGVRVSEVRAYLRGLDGVSEIHDLHIWALSTRQNALSVHIIRRDEKLDNDFLHVIQEHLHHHFNISHVTVQVESEKGKNRCSLNHPECI